MDEFLRQLEANLAYLAQPAIGLWLGIWSLRRRLESDYKLSRTARWIRWTIVLVCWIVASIPLKRIGPIRALGLVIGLAFLWWPNFAFHFLRLVHRVQSGKWDPYPGELVPRERGKFVVLRLHDPALIRNEMKIHGNK